LFGNLQSSGPEFPAFLRATSCQKRGCVALTDPRARARSSTTCRGRLTFCTTPIIGEEELLKRDPTRSLNDLTTHPIGFIRCQKYRDFGRSGTALLRVPAQDSDPRRTTSRAADQADGVPIGAWWTGWTPGLVVAVANKLARIACSVVSSRNEYRSTALPV
jgi:hypothetical protein